jgi:mono/diheme cytochrome c family protein
VYLNLRNIIIAFALAGSLAVYLYAADAPASEFDSSVKPVLAKTCAMCHNDRLSSGGLNITAFLTPDSIVTYRQGWETILQKLRAGEMPPKGIPRPPEAQLQALVSYVEGEFDKADRNTKPDPGRVTARRLNRAEYSNTIRDLLAVDFRAERDFPTDDSGYGFDNIADVLTISPVLMDRYMDAAETIASRAMGADPLPKKPLEVQYHTKDKTIRRLDLSTIEATHRVEWDGDYTIRIGMPGERAADAKPVTLGFWMDGKLLKTLPVETKPSKLVYFDPYSEAEMRLYLPSGDHVFRAGFIDDDFVKNLSEKEAYSSKKNKYLNSIIFVGPYAANVEPASRKKILICDPKSGQACVEKIVSTVAAHAYRRPVTPGEVASLLKFVALARSRGQTTEQGIALAIEAMLVTPQFLFRVEHDPNPTDAQEVHRISDVELASRLSYFLWSSMPDDELLGVAEAGKLHDPAVLDAQVKRMLADPRSAALPDNFAGQWLEIRNLDVVKPDPQKFPEWGPELRDAMKAETRMFFEYILREDRALSDFIDARYTFLNARLAKYYGIPGVAGPDFRRVDLSTDQRGGILSQASVLTVSSYPTRTSVVIRGKYLLNNILGSEIPPPPADVPALDESAVGTLMSLRQQMEKHRADPMCSTCHNKMDPLGFGLENYNAIGQWRTTDGKFPVDASGTLPNGKSFTTPGEMRKLLMAQLPEFSRCLTEKMLTYALGRGLHSYDRRAIEAIDRNVAASGYRFQSLIFEIVHSVPFQMGRGDGSGNAPGNHEVKVARKEVAQR